MSGCTFFPGVGWSGSSWNLAAPFQGHGDVARPAGRAGSRFSREPSCQGGEPERPGPGRSSRQPHSQPRNGRSAAASRGHCLLLLRSVQSSPASGASERWTREPGSWRRAPGCGGSSKLCTLLARPSALLAQPSPFLSSWLLPRAEPRPRRLRRRCLRSQGLQGPSACTCPAGRLGGTRPSCPTLSTKATSRAPRNALPPFPKVERST